MRPVGLDQRELQGGSMVVEGTLTHPCPGFAVGKLAMVVVRVQGAPVQQPEYSCSGISRGGLLGRPCRPMSSRVGIASPSALGSNTELDLCSRDSLSRSAPAVLPLAVRLSPTGWTAGGASTSAFSAMQASPVLRRHTPPASYMPSACGSNGLKRSSSR